MVVRFTDSQYYMLRALARGPVPLDHFRKWDQRPLRGLFQRGLFTLNSRLTAEITNEGWEAYSATLKARLRKDPTADTFSGSEVPTHRRALKMRSS